jgi:hypothetical protein
MNLNEDDDFGFSLVSEDELKEYENKLLQQVEQKDGQVQQYNDKLQGVRNMIMPLLNNLMANPDKHYLYWPNRTEKIQQFIKRLDSYIND